MGQTVRSLRTAAIAEDRLATLVEQSRAERERARLSCEIARFQQALAWDSRELAARQAQVSIEAIWRSRRIRAERYRPTLAAWRPQPPPGEDAPERSPADDLLRTPPDFSGTASGSALNPYDLVVKLFDIGLMIASCRDLANDAVAARLNAAAGKLDRLIGDIGLTAFERRFDAPELDGVDAGIPSHHAVLLLLKEASLTIDALLQTALYNSESTAVDLTDASQAVHRAMIVASSSRDRRGREPSVFSMARDREDLWMRLLGGSVLPDFD
jgi:hypothetical protein